MAPNESEERENTKMPLKAPEPRADLEVGNLYVGDINEGFEGMLHYYCLDFSTSC